MSTESVLDALVATCARADMARSFAPSLAVGAKYFEGVQRAVVRRLDMEERSGEATSVGALLPQVRAWRPEVQLARHALQSDPGLAALQLAVVANGSGRFCVALPKSAALFVCGHTVPVVGKTIVAWTDTELNISSELGSSSFWRALGQWAPCAQNDTHCVVVQTETYGPFYVLDGREAVATGELLGVRLMTPLDANSVPATVASICGALTLLQSAAAGHARWIAQILRGLVVVNAVDTELGTLPGLAALPVGLEPVEYAEALVLAAAQQYRHQLAMATPLASSDREQVCYVAHKRGYTTTRRALAAAHGYANAAAVLDLLASIPSLARYCARHGTLRRLALCLECAPLLNESNALTSSGRALWHHVQTRPAPEMSRGEVEAPL